MLAWRWHCQGLEDLTLKCDVRYCAYRLHCRRLQQLHHPPWPSPNRRRRTARHYRRRLHSTFRPLRSTSARRRATPCQPDRGSCRALQTRYDTGLDPPRAGPRPSRSRSSASRATRKCATASASAGSSGSGTGLSRNAGPACGAPRGWPAAEGS